jgi:hypothetical protein
MPPQPSRTSWLSRTWWGWGLAAGLVALHTGGLVERLHCGSRGCGSGVRLFDPDAVGGLPRTVTTVLFLVTAVLAWRGARRAAGRLARWWTAIAGVGAGLAVLKLVSAHSLAKADAAGLTQAGSVAVAVATLTVLWVLGRRWGVAAAGPVVLALAVYAAAAIGLDVVTALVAAVQTHAGALQAAAATLVEELGEALAALVLLVTVHRQAAVDEPRRGHEAAQPPGLLPE